jgi:hypothetical protein
LEAAQKGTMNIFAGLNLGETEADGRIVLQSVHSARHLRHSRL